MKVLNMKNKFLLSLCLAMPLAAYADANSHLHQVETLFRLTKMENKFNESVDNVIKMQLRQNPALASHRDEVRAFFQKYIGWSAMKSEITQMYVDNFSEKELKQINDFYITPTGQKLINSLPQLVQQRNQLAMQRLQQHIGELQLIAEQAAEPAQKP